ncbi:AraC family transcriptional regulator [Paenibacillus aquistagni]|uniref:AraC family transcriptional regulator n=1 Tax=Paenibacillus aquistagni TaxID=1852522 RepID=UPI000B50F3C9|nr:AraC family transcriptional regulator [Paenibacillus aquistagni]
MYRLLIADDEALEREGLEWIITRMMPETFHIIHASNGREAIQKADEYRPHIVMMDVQMPGIQGLDALKEIKAHNPTVKMVLVTAYEYFDYAQQALSLGVKEYLVKPAKRERIVSVLQRLMDEIKEERASRGEQLAIREKYLQLLPLAETELALAFMSDRTHGREVEAQRLAELLELSWQQGLALVIALKQADASNSTQAAEDRRKPIADTVRGLFSEQIKDRYRWIASPLLHEHIVIFLFAREGMEEDVLLQELRELGTALLKPLEQRCAIQASIGIGSIQTELEGMRRSYDEAVFASTYPSSWGRICAFANLQHPVQEEYKRQGERVSDEAASERSYVELAIKRIREEREQHTYNVVERAGAYIQERYQEELSLEEVAEQVHLNPHYFSKVFKQQTGETFIDYVTRLRIDKAKALILEGQFSLKEVCYMIGYKDPNYFSRVFKKVTGVTPTEYRTR